MKASGRGKKRRLDPADCIEDRGLLQGKSKSEKNDNGKEKGKGKGKGKGLLLEKGKGKGLLLEKAKGKRSKGGQLHMSWVREGWVPASGSASASAALAAVKARPPPVSWLASFVAGDPGLKKSASAWHEHLGTISGDGTQATETRIREYRKTIAAAKTIVQAGSVGDSTAKASALAATAREQIALFAEFEKAQTTRQSAGLFTNTRKQDSIQKSDVVVSNHNAALDMMLHGDEAALAATLTVDRLCRVHSVLCQDSARGARSLVAGQLRTTNARCGKKRWCPPEEVPARLQSFVEAANAILADRDIDVLHQAAAVCIGFVEVHPFPDGNGRLARILCNWVLRRSGVPFTICFCSTPGQRKVFVDALIAGHGDNLLQPLVQLIATLLKNAWTEMDRLEQRRSKTKAAQVQEKAVKDHRAAARLQSCMICLEDPADNAPNIATLCCGSAIHLNCLAEWLSSAEIPTCVQCREPFPRPKPRPAAPAAANAAGDGGALAAGAGPNADESSEDHETTTTDDARQSSDELDTTTTTDELETTTTTTGSNSEQEGETTADEAGGAAGGATRATLRALLEQHQRQRCVHCTSQAAVACTNLSCGQCCTMYGCYYCSRHSN